MKPKLLKFDETIYDLSKANFVFIEKNTVKIAYGDLKVCLDYETKEEAISCLDRCYEIMKS